MRLGSIAILEAREVITGFPMAAFALHARGQLVESKISALSSMGRVTAETLDLVVS